MKVMRFEVTPVAFEHVFISGNSLTIDEGIPEDGKVIRAGYDSVRDVFYLIVQSESFDEVAEGDVIPPANFILSRNPKRQAA